MTNDRPLTATIIGSYRKHFDRIWRAAEEFRALGVTVLRPATSEVADDSGAVVKLVGDPDDAAAIRRAQLDAIKASDFVFCVNPGSYLGDDSVFDLGGAVMAGKPVFLREPALPSQAFSVHCRGVVAPAAIVEQLRGHDEPFEPVPAVSKDLS
jgi:hypothetical protein